MPAFADGHFFERPTIVPDELNPQQKHDFRNSKMIANCIKLKKCFIFNYNRWDAKKTSWG
jgi:hypothetical protein